MACKYPVIAGQKCPCLKFTQIMKKTIETSHIPGRNWWGLERVMSTYESFCAFFGADFAIIMQGQRGPTQYFTDVLRNKRIREEEEPHIREKGKRNN